MTDTVRVPKEPNPALLPVIASIVRRLAIPTNIDPDEVYFDNGHARQIYAAIVAVSPQGEGSPADPASIKPSADTGELRERVLASIGSAWAHGTHGKPFDVKAETDAILDLIQLEGEK